jgi:hypothetical protein
MNPFLTILMMLAITGCAKADDYGGIVGFANVVAWVVGIIFSVWVWRQVSLSRSVARNFEKEFKRDEELACLHARMSALQTLTVAIAKASPQSEEIKAQFIAATEDRRRALQTTPMTIERVDALMQPFEDCLAEWKL